MRKIKAFPILLAVANKETDLVCLLVFREAGRTNVHGEARRQSDGVSIIHQVLSTL